MASLRRAAGAVTSMTPMYTSFSRSAGAARRILAAGFLEESSGRFALTVFIMLGVALLLVGVYVAWLRHRERAMDKARREYTITASSGSGGSVGAAGGAMGPVGVVWAMHPQTGQIQPMPYAMPDMHGRMLTTPGGSADLSVIAGLEHAPLRATSGAPVAGDGYGPAIGAGVGTRPFAGVGGQVTVPVGPPIMASHAPTVPTTGTTMATPPPSLVGPPAATAATATAGEAKAAAPAADTVTAAGLPRPLPTPPPLGAAGRQGSSHGVALLPPVVGAEAPTRRRNRPVLQPLTTVQDRLNHLIADPLSPAHSPARGMGVPGALRSPMLGARPILSPGGGTMVSHPPPTPQAVHDYRAGLHTTHSALLGASAALPAVASPLPSPVGQPSFVVEEKTGLQLRADVMSPASRATEDDEDDPMWNMIIAAQSGLSPSVGAEAGASGPVAIEQ